jgi:hypothetical protein
MPSTVRRKTVGSSDTPVYLLENLAELELELLRLVAFLLIDREPETELQWPDR